MQKIVSLRESERVEDVFEGVQVTEITERKHDVETLIELIEGADGIFVHSETPVTSQVIERTPSLRAIGKPGSGVDNIDLDTATRKGVVVIHTPGLNATAVAEFNIGLLISLYRSIPSAQEHLRAGGWRSEQWEGSELDNKTVGIIGLGHTARATAERLRAFGVDLLGLDPYVSESEAERFGITKVEHNEVFSESDIVMVHARLTKETRHMIGADEFGLMDDSAVLVNTARGEIIDDGALVDALETGGIGGAAIDVYEEEPPSEDNPLFDLPNVVTTPHLGGATVETRTGIMRTAAEKLVSVLNGELINLRFIANPDVLS